MEKVTKQINVYFVIHILYIDTQILLKNIMYALLTLTI